MMLWSTLVTLLSHWRRNPLQLAAMFIGVALATALWSGVQAVNGEARASYDRAAALMGGGRFERLIPREGRHMPQAVFAELRRAGHAVSPVLEGDLTLDGRRYRLIGIEPVSMPLEALPAPIAGDATEERAFAFLFPPWQLIAAPETVAALRHLPDLPERIADAALPPRTLISDIGAAQSLLGRSGEISHLILHPETHIPAPARWGLTRAAAGEADGLAGLTDSFHLNLTAFGFLAFAVGLFITHGAAGLAAEQRRGIYRTLRAIGVPARSLALALFLEMMAIALTAGIAGVLLGYGIAALLLPDVAASLAGLYGVAVSGALTLRAEWWLGSLGMSLGGALAAVGAALWTAYRMPPLASAQPQAWMRARKARFRASLAAALLLAAGALAGLSLGGGLAAGFLTLGAVLLGAALMLPILLDLILRLGARLSRSAIAEWVWADMRQQLSGLSLALMALMLALAANIGVTTMVDGFRATFLDWLDKRLAAEIYVRGIAEAEMPAFLAWAGAHPDIREALPARQARHWIEGQPVEILGIADASTYREDWPLIEALPTPWDRLHSGEGVLISEQLAHRLGLTLGARLALPAGDRQVAGIYPDYGNPLGQILIALPDLARAFPEARRLGTGLRIARAKADAVGAEIARRFSLSPDQVTDQAVVKRAAVAIFEKTFAVTAALNVLTLAIAGAALFMSMLTLADRRLPGLAPLWAMGLTRRMLARIEFAKTLGLVLLTALLAIPLGLVLAWLLVSVINVEAFGWRLPLHLFPGSWAQLTGLSLIVAALAAGLPVARLGRIAPARLIKVFADAP